MTTENSNNDNLSKTPELASEKTEKNESVIDKTTVALTDKEVMISQFQYIGLTKEEAEHTRNF